MPEVFINYRTGDGDEAAALIGERLSDRFGAELVFRASRSIRPGEAFPEELLQAVRCSPVLLAVMGPDWSRDVRLGDANDWVRREILTAIEHGARVIPVLRGRKTDRLKMADLPPELAGLADVQSLRLDMATATADVERIGDVLAELVPALRAADRTANRRADAGARHEAQSAASRTSAGSVITGSSGPVHTGSGSIYQDSQHLSGDGAAYIAGDSHGGISHQFGAPPGGEDKR
jgi:hypothetical protein